MTPAQGTQADPPAAFDLLWGQRSAGKRGPRPMLSAAEIARAGIAVADADGLGAVTMQRVADDLTALVASGKITAACLPISVPYPTPIPLLAIRHMVNSDFPFLAVSVAWIEEYLRKFAPAVPAVARLAKY